MSKISELTDGGSLLPTDTLIAVRSGANVKVVNDTINVTTLNPDQINMGDNEQIRLGDSQDLLIYHDGTNSRINDNGIGNLLLQTGGVTKLEVTSTGIDVTGTVTADGLISELSTDTQGRFSGWSVVGANADSGAIELGQTSAYQGVISYSATGSTRFIFDNTYGSAASTFEFRTNTSTTPKTHLKIDGSGNISFYEDTGTTAKLFWDASAESLGIGTTSPSQPLHVYHPTTNGVATFQSGDANVNISLMDSATTAANYVGIGAVGNELTLIAGNGGEKVRIDSSGNVGIGTSSPSSVTHLVDDTSKVYDATTYQSDLTIERKNTSGSNQSAHIRFNVTGYEGSTTGEASIGAVQTANANSADLVFTTRNAGTRGERLRIDASGNVGISTTPKTWYTTYDTTALQLSSSGTIWTLATADADRRVAISNNAYINAAGSAAYTNNGPATQFMQEGGVFKFQYKASGTADAAFVFDEAMRISSTGTVLIAHTSANFASVGHGLQVTGNAYHTRDDGNPLTVNRLGINDGTIIDIMKDTVSVGSIGSEAGGYLSIGNADTGLSFLGSVDAIGPYSPSALDGRDAAIDLGTTTRRFKDLYLSGGAYLGGTGAANHLDDYEEGTWTLSFADASTGGNVSSTTGNGIYTKVGNQVTVVGAAGNIDTTGLTSGNLLYIRGLPFPSKDVSGLTAYFAGSGFFSSISYSETPQPYIPDNGASYALLSDGANILVSALSSGAADVYITITYQTT